ncbi:MAG: tRNA (guanosine(37)-N1)-methyltransferase TrmD [Firmicutes bacterium]|jgi:tRNA (guanine37-N1)-methyltransferase|nr:tRNA (guanosine(37)-N1)-methyltransferase TrmD [Bacillota bacterium]MEE3382457.1 tRNA (guanosine(37)-N1)-methyltransferase TrmD [Anaerovoracaceae bacterium]MBQ1431245.1 tRNA (guanosine(37)-N1)-methyltransferase TrmD [Bacillota bacterium]MBQ1690092.1 tRNA (guanosine(37)-N1)-methyltransferase TrmD [Bacillota bacterium]MBQ1716233.1 tRNA (guanosine(37)-N1)-methyltransferase TrmD [Bacillota bacterium]
MKINVLTTFTDMFKAITENSMTGRAVAAGLVDIDLLDIRDFTRDKHNSTDDMPFGGGCGMVMTTQPVFDCLRSIEGVREHPIIYMSPRGKIMDEELIRSLADQEEFTVLCGHYEGVDQRILDYWNIREVSIGDYILTGGELPAMVLMDSVLRFIPGVLGNQGSVEDESIYSGLLEADQYTRPRVYEGMEVPEILTQGDHKKIALWKLMQSMELTARRRPDLFRAWTESDPDLSAFTKREKKEILALSKKLLNTL